MNEIEKLEHLLSHWVDHNRDHVNTYNEWAGKAAALGKNDLSVILKRIAEESNKLEELFREALDSLQK
jgi:hypothetical protein